MITIDTSGLIALIDRSDHYHVACVAAYDADGGPYIIPVAILAEIAWFLEQRYPPAVERALIADLLDGAYTASWGPQDLKRIQDLMERYDDLPLGLSDTAVIACAERHGGRVLTLDRRHFDVVARGERTLEVLPSS